MKTTIGSLKNTGQKQLFSGAFIKLKNKKKRKKKYSPELRDIQMSSRDLIKEKVASAKQDYDGIRLFLKLQEKSASKKKDGAIKDLFKNMGQAVHKKMKAEAKAKAKQKRKSPTANTGWFGM